MTADQKAICRELLRLSYQYGFDSSYPLAPIAAEVGVLAGLSLYDVDNKSGLLYDLGDRGSGLLEVADDGSSASVNLETRELLEAWCR